MRRDMVKIVTERGKAGGWTTFGRMTRDFEALPSREGMRQRYRYSPKICRFRPAALRRFLDSRVGARWTDVWAEIKRTLTGNSPAIQDALYFIRSAVECHAFLQDGMVFAYKWGKKYLVSDVCKLYVHPATGLLERAMPRKTWRQLRRERDAQRASEMTARRRDVSDTAQFHKLNGNWFEVSLDKLPAHRKSRSLAALAFEIRRDVVTGAIVQYVSDMYGEEEYGKPGYYATKKRQLSRKELKRYRLAQDKALQA